MTDKSVIIVIWNLILVISWYALVIIYFFQSSQRSTLPCSTLSPHMAHKIAFSSSFSVNSFFRAVSFGTLVYSSCSDSSCPRFIWLFHMHFSKKILFNHFSVLLRCYCKWLSFTLSFAFAFMWIRSHIKIIHRFSPLKFSQHKNL